MAEENHTENIKEIVTEAIEHHGIGSDALIPILLDINTNLGYIPRESLKEVAQRLNHPEAHMWVREGHLFSLGSFYHMLSLKPRGRHTVLFCESAPCHVSGGRRLWTAIQKQLGIRAGETTADGKWSLVTTSCLGLCAIGPVMLIDDDLYSCVKPEQLPEILARYE